MVATVHDGYLQLQQSDDEATDTLMVSKSEAPKLFRAFAERAANATQYEPSRQDDRRNAAAALNVLVKRAGGEVVVSIAEIDNTRQNLLAMQLDEGARSFRFVVQKKS